MTFGDVFSTSVHSLKSHKLRSLLTMLGIIIGVGAVVLMVSVGSTLQGYVTDQIESLGSNIIEVFPSGLEKFGRRNDTITEDDYRAIMRLSTVRSVAPVIFVGEKVLYGNQEEKPTIFGTTKEFISNYSQKIQFGRLIDDRDESGAKHVAVLGYQVAEDLFEGRDPLDKKITIGGKSFTVVGVLESQGSLLLSDLDSVVYIPYAAAKSLTGQKYLSYMSLLSTGNDDLALQDITLLLRKRHKLNNPNNDPDKDDFAARSAAQATEIVGTVTTGLTVFLGLIAGISLVVGGIGIMNIMLVSVTERTMEIGLRKAVGARRQDILLQFLIESTMLTLIGGVIGIVGGTLLAVTIALIAGTFLGELKFVFSWTALVAAMAMAMGTGLAFGIYPARKAALLSPIEAIRQE